MRNFTPRPWVLLACALACVALAYSGVLGGGYVWDDHTLIEDEPIVQELQPLPDYFGRTFWSNPEQFSPRHFYRPLTTLSYAIDQQIWNGNPFGFHLTNLLLHLGCVTLVFLLARRGGASAAAAAIAAGLFGLLPRLSESVGWISGRTDLLAGLSALAVLLLHRSEPNATARRVCGAAALAMGLLSKEVAAAGLVGVLALEIAGVRRSRETWRRAAANLAPYLIAAALYAAIRSAANLPDRLPSYFSISERLVIALQALGTYLLMLLDPLRPRLQIGIAGVVEWSKVALGMLSTALIALLAWRALRDKWEPLPTAALFTGLAAMLPVLHIVPIAVNVLAADRFLYLFAAGAAVALASWSRHLTPAQLPVAAACALIAIPTFGVSTHLRSRDWRDELRLFERSIERTDPENALPRTLLGVALLRRDRTEEALVELEQSWEQQKAFWFNYTWAAEDMFVPANIAIARAELGLHEEAIEAMREVIRLGPWVPLSRYNLALMFAQTFQFEKAEQQLRVAILMYPGYERARRMLAELGPVRDAWRALPEERADEPSSLSASRAVLYARMGRLDDAVRHWDRVALSEDASPDELLRAATFLVARADLEVAERAFERLRTALPESPKLPMIERALAGRRSAYVF